MKRTGSVLRVGAVLMALLVVGAAQASGASIGLFSTPDCSSCNLTMNTPGVGTLYISVVATGLDPVVGSEFKVVGLPAGWFVSVSPNPNANVVVGDPFGEIGAGIVFPTGQPGPCVHLYTVTVFATTSVNDVVLRVTMRTPPTNPNKPCPVVFIECDPCDTSVCVGGGSLFINSSTECTVAIEEGTWSQVKRLFE